MSPLESLLDFARNHVPFHRRRAPSNPLVLGHWPLMSKHDLAEHALDKSDDLLSLPRDPQGYLLLSGGTTGTPKYLFYSQQEADEACRKIAHNFSANGLEPGDRVVNYFPAGHMWASFLMVDRALSTLPVTILPLGYTHDIDFAVDILDRFKPSAIAGIPSTIVELVRHAAHTRKHIRVEKIFYAGEPLSSEAEARIRADWGSRLVRSAGYASTDFGPIGWQCRHCETGEHHVFDDVVVELIEGEIVATAVSRRAMPFIRYRTGDAGEWLHGACACGDRAGRFRLLGRIDNVILIWGSRILYDDLVRALKSCDSAIDALQVHVQACGEAGRLLLRTDSPVEESMLPALRDSIYRHCLDLRQTVPRDWLDQHLAFESAPAGGVQRNPRTKKLIPIIDTR